MDIAPRNFGGIIKTPRKQSHELTKKKKAEKAGGAGESSTSGRSADDPKERKEKSCPADATGKKKTSCKKTTMRGGWVTRTEDCLDQNRMSVGKN